MAKVFTIHLNTNFRKPFWTDHSLAISFVHPHHLTLVSFYLQDNDSDFLCFLLWELYSSYQKASVGEHFIFVVIVKKKKKESGEEKKNKEKE